MNNNLEDFMNIPQDIVNKLHQHALERRTHQDARLGRVLHNNALEALILELSEEIEV